MSHLNGLCNFATSAIHEHYIWLYLEYSVAVRGIEQFEFLPTFFDILLHNQHKLLKFCLCVLYNHIEGTGSQIFD